MRNGSRHPYPALLWEDPSVMLPETVAGRPVTELAAYAFSDHIDQRELETAMQKGRFCREYGEPAKETEEMPEKRTAVSGEASHGSDPAGNIKENRALCLL